MERVPVPVVDVVDMVAMAHRGVAAVWAVPVLVGGVLLMAGCLALVGMVAVHAVDVPVMHVVDVVAMLEGLVAAAGVVPMGVIGMWSVFGCGGHASPR